MHAHSLAVAHITAPAMLRVAGPALDRRQEGELNDIVPVPIRLY
jgi:hypothetical protein